MSYIIDIIIIAIVLLTILFSAKRGFVRTVVEVAGFVLAFLISINLGNFFSTITYDKVIEPALVSAVADKSLENASTTVDSVWDALPNVLIKNGEAFGVSKDILLEKLSGSAESTETALTEFSQTAIKPMATTFFSSIYSLILFLVLLFAVGFLSKAINKLFSFSIAGKLNRFLGGVIGIPKGIIFGYIFCILLTALFFFAPNGLWLFTRENTDKSYLYSLLMLFSPFK